MTTHHPVTEKELDQIAENSPHEWDTIKRVIATRTLIREVLSRPDPLALLEAWREWKDTNWIVGCGADVWCEEAKFIKRLHNNPETVIQQGIEEGWWKE